MSDLEYPAGLRYTAEHEWVRADGDTVRVGITSFAQEALGDVVYVSLPAIGDAVVSGDTCGEVESTKSVSDLYAPVSGEVTAVNPALDATPELVNSDPYGEGWMYELRVSDAGRPGQPDGRRGVHRAALLTSLGSDHRKGWANDGAVI
jgi:glycine cleavage system H protein